MIGGQFIVVGIVGKNALACLVDNVVVNIGIVDIVEHDALVAAADGDIVKHFEPLGKHQHISHIVAHRNIAADFAVVGVHIVNGETQITEAVVFIGVVRAGIRKNTVPPFGNVVTDNLRAGCVPNGNAVAALIHAQSRVADDFILAYHRIGRTMQIYADRIIKNIVVFNQGARGGFFEINTGIHCRQAHTGTGNGQVTERYVRRMHSYRTAAPIPFDGCRTVGRPFNRNRFVNMKFGFIYAGSKFKCVACMGMGKNFGKIVLRGNVDDGCRCRLKNTAAGKYQHGPQPYTERGCVHGVPLFRSVWQNKMKHDSNMSVFIAKPSERIPQTVWL